MKIWNKCKNCDDYWCNIHNEHVYDCECPGLEEWSINPYLEDLCIKNSDLQNPTH